MPETEKIYLSAILQTCNFVQIDLKQLLTQHQTFKKIWESGPDTWGIVREQSKTAIKQRYTQFLLQQFIEKLEKTNTKLLTIYDKEYPKLLASINEPPILLYYQGDISLSNNVSLGIVGTREPSTYGERIIEKLIPDLTAVGLVIVSGFQRGIDTLAHKETIQNKGQTIAILGTGIDVEYPAQNRHLFKTMSNEHLVLTEYPFGTLPAQYNFPRRNRIITGLSVGTLVVEAALKSGSLVSAKFAAEQGREVFSVPGSIFAKTSSGTNYLIQQGATPTTSSEDILTALKIEYLKKSKQTTKLTEIQIKIVSALQSERNLDELIELLKLPAPDILAEITLLTLSGEVIQTSDNTFVSQSEI